MTAMFLLAALVGLVVLLCGPWFWSLIRAAGRDREWHSGIDRTGVRCPRIP